MSFTWSPMGVAVGDKVTISTNTKIQELRDNVDTLCSGISITQPVWESLDGVGNELKLYSLQSEIDRVDDENYCRTDMLSHNSVYDAVHDTTDDIGYLLSECPTANLSADAVKYTGVLGSDHITERHTDNSPQVSFNESLYLNTACGDT